LSEPSRATAAVFMVNGEAPFRALLFITGDTSVSGVLFTTLGAEFHARPYPSVLLASFLALWYTIPCVHQIQHLRISDPFDPRQLLVQ